MQLFTAALVLACVGYAVSQETPEVQPHPHPIAPIGDGTEHCVNCDVQAQCEYRGIGGNGARQFECVCKSGFRGDGLKCAAVNPCDEGLDNCDSNADCKVVGENSGYTCSCRAGFTGDGFTCTDIQECDTPNRCDATNSICVNTIGSYECNCRSGFVHPTTVSGAIDLNKCVDLNECGLTQTQCPANSVCQNTVGSYTCACITGFTISDNGRFCQEIDECAQLGTIRCNSANSECRNIPGGFECDCKPGYQHNGDVINCYDVNECSDVSLFTCPTNSVCSNTAGGYMCNCNTGFALNADGNFCLDVNECVGNFYPCDKNRSVCLNTPGGYECTCNRGYSHATINKKICADVNECVEGPNPCSQYATCANKIGSYECSCFYGYVGNGELCTEASPSLSQLEASIANLTMTQLNLRLHTAYYENLHLKTELERYKRLCPLKKANLLPAGTRVRRDLQSDLNALTSGTMVDQKFRLQSLLHANSEVNLQISILKRECGFN